MVVPVLAVAGPVFTTCTLIGVGVMLEVLFAGTGSFCAPEIVAVFVKTPVAFTVAVMVSVALAPLFRLPIVQAPVPLV
ncbi:hypothetical protein D3C85_1020940 [compost metagenome]